MVSIPLNVSRICHEPRIISCLLFLPLSRFQSLLSPTTTRCCRNPFYEQSNICGCRGAFCHVCSMIYLMHLQGNPRLGHRVASSLAFGDSAAMQSLMPLVYDELWRLAHYYLRNEATTLQSTALVHEAYVRLTGNAPPQWQGPCSFFGIAAYLMRQILVEYAQPGHCQAWRLYYSAPLPLIPSSHCTMRCKILPRVSDLPHIGIRRFPG